MANTTKPNSITVQQLKRAEKYGLLFEVIETALSLKGENPSTSNREVFEQACMEWDV